MKRFGLALVKLLMVAGAHAAGPTNYYWYDGGVRRELWLESSQVADFSGNAGSGRALIKAAPAGVTLESLARDKNADAAGANVKVSPMFRDRSGADEPMRALPGGVIVTLKQALPLDEARRLLEARGLRPVRPIGDSTAMWLVDAPAGVASLTLANQLHESGDYQSAAPNWWRPRALK